MIIDYNRPDDPGPGSGTDATEEATVKTENSGTIILDATCVPQNISYPQYVNLLNEARVNWEGMIDRICYDYNYYKPRMYREKARKDYLNLARCKKRTAKKIRKAIRQQLQHIRRNRAYINAYLEAGVELTVKQTGPKKSLMKSVSSCCTYMKIRFIPYRTGSSASASHISG